ncbi:fumarate reductase flavoprotein subunit [Saccharopolyspora lacisalsi]|uniref:Fumarate reductase flavoprotein subunit n=1 Tax=Halosaccharopolyspora lacisalsi TaxID=1000566 RepID=A0A839DTR3_9PSEU|nr:FAD-binding protein [Halosaccharopolyspora lacisalsi]MBA8824149.1 fumarate reductase flavoprotein subunit [Halosaccharopolyspora lacisalsi]
MTIDVDLVVAGAGGGLTAALRAAELGLDVLVVDSDPNFRRGNNTSMSTAMIPGPGSRFQTTAGIVDSPARFVADITCKTGGAADMRIASALACVSAELIEWLADHVGIPIELPTDFTYPGHSAPRVHSLPGRHGSSLLRHLLEAVDSTERIDLMVPARLTAVEAGPGGGRVAVVEKPDGAREEISSRAVLLATNGYGADAALVATHLPEIAGAHYHGGEHSRGDALRIGGELGAAAGFLDAYQGHAALSAAAQTLVTWTAVMHGAAVVDTGARRFGDETTGYSEYAAALAARPGGRGWLVFDERIDGLCRAFGDYQDVLAAGAVRTADTVAELAAVAGLPENALKSELDALTRVAAGEQADRFGRTTATPLRAPFHAVEIVPALFHTQGGLLVDEHARVLDPAGGPITGLYAAGGAAASISGHGAAGYLAGNGLLPALGLAYLAAGHLARSASATRSLAPEGTR